MTSRAETRPKRTYVPRTFTSMGADALTFVIAVTASFSVQLVGSLPVSEIILIPLFPILLSLRLRKVVKPGLRIVFILMAFWLFGQVLTDVYRGTEAVDWMRGDATIIFFGMDIAGLAVLLSGNDRRKIVFATGFAAGSLLAVRLQPSVYALEEPWKFGYSNGIILLVILIGCYFYSRRRYIIVGLLFASIVGVNLLENYRSPVLFLLVTMVLVLPLIPGRVGNLQILPRSSILRVAVLVGFALLAGKAASTLVDLVTTAGLVGEAAHAKNQEEAKAGLLLGGRPEILVSTRAVLDSPILGHGSWARDFKYVEMLNDMLAEAGMQTNLADLEAASTGIIPAHSHLMGAWVSAGILGAVFWAYLLWSVIQGLVKVSILRPPMAPLYAYLIVGIVWSILFSPFGSAGRMGEALTVVISVDLLETGAYRVDVLKWARRGKWKRKGFRSRLQGADGTQISGPQARI